jgi:uncharacterized phiE125 gp8 family phage protein
VSLTLVSAPAVEPLSLPMAKAAQRISTNLEDLLIGGYIAAARQSVENFVKCSLLSTVWKKTYDCFPRLILLPVGPVLTSAGLSISYIAGDGAAQTLPSTAYKVSLGETGRIAPAFDAPWPSTRNEIDAVSVTFTAGWPTPDDVPPVMMQALRMAFGDFFEHRENIAVSEQFSANTVIELPIGIKNLLLPWVRWRGDDN